MTLSHPQFHEKNFTETIAFLLDNGYPLEFIFSNMHNRIKKFTHSRDQYNSSPPHTSINSKKYFTVPYVKNTSESFKSKQKTVYKVPQSQCNEQSLDVA